jgi:hypothetical protein
MRNHVCIWIIFGGLINFLAYTIIYAELGGDAKNGDIERIEHEDGTVDQVFSIRGHFIRGPTGESTPVRKWVWVYSYVHSISLWPTQGMMMICMLMLAQPHIIATMRESNWIRGPTFIAVAITLVAVFYTAMSVWFTIGFISNLST